MVSPKKPENRFATTLLTTTRLHYQLQRIMALLPTVPNHADSGGATALPSRWIALCFTLTFLIYLAFIPQIIKYSNPPTGDQAFYLMDTISLAQDGDLELSNNYNNLDEDKFYSLAPQPDDYVGISAPYPLTPQMAESSARPPEEIYGFHPPGLGAMLVPAWIIGGWFQLWWPATTIFMCLVGALVSTNIFLLSYEVTGRQWVAWVVWAALAFTGPIMSYSYLIFSELPTGLLVIYAFRRLALGWKANGPLRLLAVGFCIGFIPWLAERCLPISAALFLYMLVQWWRSIAPEDLPTLKTGARLKLMRRVAFQGVSRDFLRIIAFLAPIVVLAVVLLAYHIFLYGTVVPPSDERGGSGVGEFYWPWDGRYELKQFLTGAFGLLFSQRFGLLTFTPIYLLALVGVFAMFRTGRGSDRRLLGWITLASLPYMAMIAAYSSWGGDWCPPARYASTLVPLLAAPMAVSLAALAGSVVYKVLYALLALPGFIFMAVMLYNPLTMWSGAWSAVFEWIATNEHSPLHVDLRPFVPRFNSPDEVWFPLRTGWLLLVSMLIVLVGVLLLLRLDKVAPSRSTVAGRSNARLLTVSLVIVALIIAGWGIINYDFLHPKTTFQYVTHWILPEQLPNNGAIAYLDGKVYIPAFGERQEDGWLPGYIGVLDTTTGDYSRLEAKAENGKPIVWEHPSSVTIGPDGLLYVLNNGEGDQALFAIQPDGTVVRQIALDGKTPLGKALYFGDDGTMYLADQLLGSVLRYAKTGGEPLTVYNGEDEILNNPRGVAVDADGYVYTTETYKRIQKLDQNDDVIATYQLYCIPDYFVDSPVADQWIEGSCDTGLLSVNTQDNYVQLAQYRGNGPRPDNPQGLAYSPDGMLFVTSGDKILEYRVTH